MRETRQSGSEGGGVGTTGAPYPYPRELPLRVASAFAIPVPADGRVKPGYDELGWPVRTLEESMFTRAEFTRAEL